jgi:long-chain acyl-CoA synthetase
MSFEAVQTLGAERLGRDGEDWWLGEIAKGSPDDTAIILYTSGTTGRPKGVVLTMGATVWAAETANRFDNLDKDEEVIAYLPMAWVGDHIFSYAQSYTSGYCVNCPENRETVVEDRRHLRLCAAAHLRKPDHPDHGQDGGRRAREKGDVRRLPGAGQAGGREDPQR